MRSHPCCRSVSIRLAIDGGERVRRVGEAAREMLTQEALIETLEVGAAAFEGERREVSVDGEALVLVLGRLGAPQR